MAQRFYKPANETGVRGRKRILASLLPWLPPDRHHLAYTTDEPAPGGSLEGPPGLEEGPPRGKIDEGMNSIRAMRYRARNRLALLWPMGAGPTVGGARERLIGRGGGNEGPAGRAQQGLDQGGHRGPFCSPRWPWQWARNLTCKASIRGFGPYSTRDSSVDGVGRGRFKGVDMKEMCRR